MELVQDVFVKEQRAVRSKFGTLLIPQRDLLATWMKVRSNLSTITDGTEVFCEADLMNCTSRISEEVAEELIGQP